MKDTNELPEEIVVGEPRYSAPYDQGTPAGVPPVTRSARTVARLASYRVAPAGTSLARLQLARGHISRAAWLVSKGWTQGILAAEDGGFECNPLSERAKAWNVHGAMIRAIGTARVERGSSSDIAWMAIQQSIKDRHGCSVVWFNDQVAANDTDIRSELHAAVDVIDGIIQERGFK